MSDYQGNIIIKNPATPTGPSAYGSAPGMWSLNEVAYWIKQGVWPNPAITPDTYFPYVSLLLSTTSLGNANNNLFVDSSGAFNPVSRNGNTTQGSFSPYSTNWSNYFDGSGDYIQTPAGSATTLVGTMNGSTNLTIECWIFPTAYNNNSGNFPGLIGDMSPTSQVDYWSWGLTTTGVLMLYWWIAGTQYRVYTTNTVSLNAWTHIALNISAGAITMYINGVSQTLTGTTTLGAVGGTMGFLAIGQWNNGVASGTDAGNFTGYISNLRIVKASTYSSNFTPSTSPLTAITGTSLLTCQSNRFRDASTNNFTLTIGNDTRVTDFGPFSPAYPGAVYNQSDITNWSTYFNGSSTYLQAPNNSAFAFGTGDFTVEMWVYFTDTGGTNKPMFDTGVSTNTGRLLIRQGDNGSSANVVNAYLSGTTAGSPTFNFNEWTHVAVVRSSGTLKIYINGVGGTGVSATANLTETAGILGKFYDVGIYFSGSMSNVRAVKGTAVYTSNFTPPTTNLTAISGTSLLTCQNAAFTDNSSNNFIITPNGAPTVTGNSPFNTVGYWSNYFNGGTDRLQVPVTSNMYLGTTYTIEAWVYYTGSSYGARPIFSEMEPFQGGFAGLTLTMNTSGQFVFEYRPATSGAVTTITGPTVTPNTWYHIAVSNNATSAKLFVNGVQVGSTTTIGDYPSAKTNTVAVGSWGSGWNDGGIPAAAWIGYISNLRVVKGTAVYTANFTPPTAPLTAISGTVLLTCQNGRFIDNSSVNNTLTPVTTVAVQSFDPFYTSTTTSSGGSMYFDGNGDYLALQNSPNYALGRGDFLLDMWVYPITQGGHGSGNNDCLMDFRPGSPSGGFGCLYLYNNGSNVMWFIQTWGNVITGAAIRNGAWTHLCVSRVSDNTRLFINGVQSGSTYSDSTTYAQTDPWIGQFHDGSGGGYFNGYMTAPRIIKGSGVSANFTPPTAPVNPTANTTLLINGMNAGIYDATTINDMETVGNAQVSTVQSKFGGSSVYFDGSGDYLAVPPNSQSVLLGTASFTVEFWINPNSSQPSTRTPIVSFGNGFTTNVWAIQLNNTSPSYVNRIQLWAYNLNSGAVVAASTGTISASTWTHVAVVRNGSNFTIYINGVADGTGSSSASMDGGSTTLQFQVGYNSPDYYAGYIDDLRITKGVARYTSNFTPPTQAFPTY